LYLPFFARKLNDVFGPVLFQIGSFEVRCYGMISQFLLALWFGTREARGNGLRATDIQDFVLYALVGGSIGARLYYVLYSRPAYFLQNPSEILAVWAGRDRRHWFAFRGTRCRAVILPPEKDFHLGLLGDTLAPAIALGQTLASLFAC
jgi:phosphatidylglycerol:prolipoprotein diacylglycerol transferase